MFTPKSGVQLRKKILKVKNSGAKKSRVFFKNSKQHTKSFVKQAKLLAKNISHELQDFKKGILDDKD
ncbi:hypothetical protein X556_0235 [Chlamydia pneumoniae B21]|nr:hypothetical protein X556_0235 [Chlamydia pneumoniae B21]